MIPVGGTHLWTGVHQDSGVFLTLAMRGLLCIESLTTPTLGDDMFPVRWTVVEERQLYLNTICYNPD